MVEIAKLVGCSFSTIQTYLKKFDIETRTTAEALLGKYSGSKNPFWGKCHSKETKEKISKANSGRTWKLNPKQIERISKLHKGKVLSQETKEKLRKARTGTKLSEETKRKISIATAGKNNPMFGKRRPDIIGDKNPSWKGGATRVILMIRGCGQYSEWRKSIYTRDNFSCVICGRNKSDTLQADHIKPLALLIAENNIQNIKEAVSCTALWDIENGRTLCEACHKKTDTWGHRTSKIITKRLCRIKS
jgi:hypothetical protein